MRGGRLPPWWQFGVFVSVTLGAVVLGLNYFGGPDSPAFPESGFGPAEVFFTRPAEPYPGSPDGSSGGSDATSPPGTAPGLADPPDVTAPLSQVPLLSGGYVEVPSDAADLAYEAAKALFYGGLGDLPLVDGFSPPEVPRPFEDSTASDLFVVSFGASEFTFLVSVDPDGEGPEPYRPTTVRISASEGSWRVAGVGG